MSKEQLLIQIFELGINGDYMIWTSSFLTNQKVQLVINRHDNKKRKIKIGILQSFLILSILFLIYICGVLTKCWKLVFWLCLYFLLIT